MGKTVCERQKPSNYANMPITYQKNVWIKHLNPERLHLTKCGVKLQSVEINSYPTYTVISVTFVVQQILFETYLSHENRYR